MSDTTGKRIEVIGGDEYEVGTKAHAAAVRRRDSETSDLEAEIKKLEEQLAALKSRSDEEKKKLEDENSELEEEKQKLDDKIEELEKKQDSIVADRAKERARLILAARDHQVEIREDAGDHEIRCALLGKLAPAARFDAKDAKCAGEAKTILDFKLREIAEASAKSGAQNVGNALFTVRQDGAVEQESPAVKARREARERDQNAWKSGRA